MDKHLTQEGELSHTFDCHFFTFDVASPWAYRLKWPQCKGFCTPTLNNLPLILAFMC